MNESTSISEYLQPGRRAHLVGIGGVSMCALGQVLHNMGMEITGSDMQASSATRLLIDGGIPVAIGHKAENIGRAECVIRSAAIHDDNPEIAAARAAGLPVFERAQSWGELMRAYPNAVCVSGAHGKTTTTSMLTHIYMEAGRDPTVMIGGTLPLLGAGHRVGNGDTILMESCEYCNSFHNFFPTLAIILNVDADHLDFFKNLDNVKASFRHFAELVPQDTGTVLVCGENENAMNCLRGLQRRVLTFGFDESFDYYAKDFSADWRRFDVYGPQGLYCHVKLQVIGRHNAMNALAAAAAAEIQGLDGQWVTKALAEFTGAGRRMEYKGVYHGAVIYDDYAHHPNEVQATLTAVRAQNYSRVVCAFQPHTYSRTKALFDEFAKALALPDVTLLAPIYAAREKDVYGVSSRDLAQAVPGAECFDDFASLQARLQELAQPGDIILTVGAGDIYKVGEALAALQED